LFIASSIVLRATRGCRRTLGQMQDLLWSSWRMECAAYARPAEEWVRPASRPCGVLGGRAGVPTPPLDPCRARLVKLASTAWPDEPSVWECDRGGMCARAGATGGRYGRVGVGARRASGLALPRVPLHARPDAGPLVLIVVQRCAAQMRGQAGRRHAARTPPARAGCVPGCAAEIRACRGECLLLYNSTDASQRQRRLGEAKLKVHLASRPTDSENPL